MYYSLLMNGNCGVTALFLDEQIDTGPVVETHDYAAPSDRTEIDYGYDPYIRSDLLVRVLRGYLDSGEFCTEQQRTDKGETYFIMHPVLRHVAILGANEGKGESEAC